MDLLVDLFVVWKMAPIFLLQTTLLLGSENQQQNKKKLDSDP